MAAVGVAIAVESGKGPGWARLAVAKGEAPPIQEARMAP
jgi:hypothetical protein